MNVAQYIAREVNRMSNLQKQGSPNMVNVTDALYSYLKDILPSGAGFDNGTQIVLEKCTNQKIVFNTSFHHMDDHGYYDGWTYHTVTVTASLVFDFDIMVSGVNRRDIKDYIAERFNALMHAEHKPQ